MATSKTHSGWTKENVLERNTENPLNEDFSILKAIDVIKDSDPSQVNYARTQLTASVSQL